MGGSGGEVGGGRKKLKHRFFVPPGRVKLGGEEERVVRLDGETTHHLRTVLRLNTGDNVTLFDNSGQEYECEIIECKPSHSTLKVVRAVDPHTESPLKITLGQALIKGNSLDRVLSLCTELGVVKIVPLVTARTVVDVKKADVDLKVRRWQKIAEQAAAQSKRVRVPRIELPVDFKDFVGKKHEGAMVILWEKGGASRLSQVIEGKVEAVTLLVGPEGGFRQDEVKQAMDAGFKIWGLGPRILRAEDSGAVAVSILQYELGDMG